MDEIVFYSPFGMEMFLHTEHGICRLTFNGDVDGVCFISTLTVDFSHRKIGIGKSLLRKAEILAKAYAYKRISLQVENNSWKKDWYKREGYEVIADGYDEDMIIMSKKLKED